MRTSISMKRAELAAQHCTVTSTNGLLWGIDDCIRDLQYLKTVINRLLEEESLSPENREKVANLVGHYMLLSLIEGMDASFDHVREVDRPFPERYRQLFLRILGEFLPPSDRASDSGIFQHGNA